MSSSKTSSRCVSASELNARRDVNSFQKTKVSIWLYDNVEMRLEGRIIVESPHFGLSHLFLNTCQGFDEYMNIVMDDASEVYVKSDQPSLPLGLSCLYVCRFLLTKF
jgi:hypothetical protein